ncbi:MAG: response regulator transcription factor [Planctomycetes bacterium]|nr:response regulator transcription factor [Planctomycetota bacterium]
MSRARILVVEDDPTILLALAEKLESEGYDAARAADGEEARRRIEDEAFDLVVLDIMLPRLDGLALLRWLRRTGSRLPVLALSAKGLEEEKVEGLKAGADDYIAKPFGLKELLARVEALLRRAHGPATRLAIGGLTLDLERRALFRGEEEVPLSRKEADLLVYLARHRDRPVSRDEILDAVWGHFASSAERAVDFHVLRLRRKLEPDPSSPRHIVTRHGRGYQLVPSP